MKIVSITDAPKTGDSDGVNVVFAQGECEPVTKRLHHSNAEQMCGQKPEWSYKLLLKMREAERDFACMIFGDKWREHVPRGGFWSGEPSDDELRLCAQAAQLRPDLFGVKD